MKAQKNKLSSVELSARLADAKEELKVAIDNGDLETMTKLRSEIRDLPDLITVTEIAELKARIADINLQLEQNADTKSLLRKVIATRKEELFEKQKELEPYIDNLNNAGLEASFAENEYQLLLQYRREANARLFSLTDSLTAEV